MSGVVWCLIILGGGALVGQAAKRRGRSFVAWSLVATLAAAASYAVVSAVGLTSIASPTLNTVAALSVFLAPIPPLLLLGALVRRLGFRTRSNRWKVFVLDGPMPAGECELMLRNGELRLARAEDAEVIPLTALETARADCECVRLGWRADDELREAVLQIVLPEAEWEVRAQVAETAALAIARAREGAEPGLPRAQASLRRPD